MEVDNATPSLLERLGESRRGTGRLAGARRSAAPYQKRQGALGTSNADADAMWKHDKHEEVAGGPLAARLHNREARPRPDTSLVTKALGFKSHQSSLSIKGAGASDERVVEVKGLVAGTSADDVKAIFQSCGPITKAWMASGLSPTPVVHLQYGKHEDAQRAIEQFNGQVADGSKLSVVFVFGTPKTVVEKVMSTDKNVDLLGSDSAPSSGKMYSDMIMETDPRSQVMTGDFNPPDTSARGGRVWRGRRGRGSRRGGNRMDVDR